MKQEFELKVLNVEPGQTVAKLQANGGKIVFGPGLVKTVLFDHPKLRLREQGIPIRVRSVGDQAYLNVKHAVAGTQTEVKVLQETELKVEDFGKMCELLKLAGFAPFRYQEKRRTTFALPGGRVELEQYPNAPAYIELECESAEATKALLIQLGYTMEQSVKLSATEVLKRAGIENPDMVRFDESTPLPNYLTLTKSDSIAQSNKTVEDVLWERD